MRFLQISLIFLLFNFTSVAQGQNNPEVGDKLIISNSSEYGYKHLLLPKANFIIKKNGRLNYARLVGQLVVVHEIKSGNNVNTVVLKRADGKKFFGSFPSIKANYEAALESGELKRS